MPHRSRLAACLTVAASLLCAGCAAKPKLDRSPTASIRLPAAAATRNAQARKSLSPSRLRYAQAESGPLTFETAVRRAVAYHPSIAESVGRLNEQREFVNEARAGYLPRVSWGVDTGVDGQGGDEEDGPTLNLRGSQVVYDFGKVDGRVKVAQAGLAGRRSEILSAVDEVARDTAYAVIEIQRGQALKRIAEQHIGDIKQVYELVQSRTSRGASTRSDELQAESRVQAAEAVLLEAVAGIDRQKTMLATLLGLPESFEVSGGIPIWLARSCARTPNWNRVPAIMRAQAEQTSAQAQIDLSRAEALPTLSLDLRLGSDIAEIGSTEPDYRLGLSANGSLYNGGESSARRRAATHALGVSEAAAARVRLEIRRELAEALGQTRSTAQLRRSLLARQETIRRTRELYQTQYAELGTRNLIDVLDAAQELFDVSARATNADYDTYRTQIGCSFSSGNIRDDFGLTGAVRRLAGT